MANPDIPEQSFPQTEISEPDLHLSEGVPIQDILAGPVPPNPDLAIFATQIADQINGLNATDVAKYIKNTDSSVAAAIPPRDDVDVEKTDFDLLHERLDELTRLVSHNNQMLQSFGPGMEYLCNSMGWLTNMLSGVAEVAQKMPGMGGMLARLAAPNKNKGN